MVKVRVAICQYATELGDRDENVRRSLEWLDRAATEEPDLVVLPELMTTGYAAGERHLDLAERVPGPTTDAWGERARKGGFNLVAGICRRDDHLEGVLYNSAVLIDSEGEVRGVYSKSVLPLYLHTWFDGGKPLFIEEAEIFRRGDDLSVFSSEVGNIGMQVCQDAVYGEFTRVQTLRGAQIVVQIFNHPAPPGGKDDILVQMSRVRACDNGIYVIAANKCGVETYRYMDREMEVTFQGESHVADPFGELIAVGRIQEPDLLVCELDLDQVRKAQWSSKFHRDYRPELLYDLIDR